ncbi:hypothetical protein E2320_012607 [Naja naja]|nr:hypothetical protein E2320_012607 [Naja naja]
MSLARCVCLLQRAGKKLSGTRPFGATMPVDLSGWGGTLSLPEVEDKPVRPLRVRYGSVEIEELGQVLTPTQVKNRPTLIEWENCNPEKFYTLALTDPDAPSRKTPKFREWHHFLVTNMRGNDISSGNVLSDYAFTFTCGWSRAAPAADFQEPILSNRWGQAQLQNIDLQEIQAGYPVAGTCYQAEWDDSCPNSEQLSGK